VFNFWIFFFQFLSNNSVYFKKDRNWQAQDNVKMKIIDNVIQKNCIEIPREKAQTIRESISADVFGEARSARYFMGSQPVTLTNERLRVVARNVNDYLVTFKADGLRFFLIVDQSLNLILYSRSGRFWLVRNARAPEGFEHCIFDGELVINTECAGAANRASPKGLIFLCCDVVEWQSQSIVNTHVLVERMRFAEEFQKHYAKNSNSQLWRFQVKHYYEIQRGGGPRLLKILQNDLEYVSDGLIFVNQTKEYVAGTDQDMFKWKPTIEMNTVDFRLWFDGTDTIFSVLAESVRGLKASQRQYLEKYRVRGNAILDFDSSKKIDNGSIFECSAELQEDEQVEWVLKQHRNDKNTPNIEKVYLETLEAICDNITIEILMQVLF